MTESSQPIQQTLVPTAARTGTTARFVLIHAEPAPQEPSTVLTGIPAPHGQAALNRVRAAIAATGLAWPRATVALTVVPEPLPAGDHGLDLALAIAVLAASGQVPTDQIPATAYLGGLAPNGDIQALPDITTRLASIPSTGPANTVVATGNLTEAALATTRPIRAARTLAQLAARLRDEATLPGPAAWPTAPDQPDADLSDLPTDWAAAARVLEIAAAGGHHLLMIGPAASADRLAQRLPGLLPDLDPVTAARVAALYRHAGILPTDAPVRRRPPWQSVHHTISVPDLAGTTRRLGTASLAHAGVLWCPDADRMPGRTRDVLRLVLDQRQITNHGANQQATYPARAQLLLSATGCPKPAAGDECGCPQHVHNRILSRTGILLDRADIQYTLPPTPATPDQPIPTTATVAARVARARAFARSAHSWPVNAEATGQQLKAALARVPVRWFGPLQHRIDAGSLSSRGATKVLRLAFTIADLAGRGTPTADDLNEAIWLRTGQRPTT